jgi:hypothetical protein
VRQVATRIIVGVEDMNSQFDIVFSMTSCLSSNTMSSVGWYVDSGALSHMTYDSIY